MHPQAHLAACSRVFLLALLSVAVFGQETLNPVWSHSFPELTVGVRPIASAVALAANGQCAAIAGAGVARVFDIDGQTRWTWEYSKANRFITPGALALSPSCDELALAGDSGYKYTWIVNRHGPRTPIATSSTPLSLAFSHDGEHLAVGTGGCDLLLINKSEEVQWKKVLRVTPAMAAGITDHIWSLEEIAMLADEAFLLKKRGPYEKTRRIS